MCLYRDEEKGLSAATLDIILNLTCSEPAFEGLLPGPLEQGEERCTVHQSYLVTMHIAAL